MAVTNPKFNPSGSAQVEAIKQAGLDMESVIRSNTEPGRRQSLAVSRLEEALMWAVKSVVVGDDE